MKTHISVLILLVLATGCEGGGGAASSGSAVQTASALTVPSPTPTVIPSPTPSPIPSASPSGAFSGGDGSIGSPFVIRTPSDLQAISTNLSANYELAENVDMSGVTFVPIGVTSGSPSTATAFTGTFVGNNYSISHLTIATGFQYAGLFGILQGSVSNLTMSGASVSGSAYTGAIAGLLSSTITGSHVSTTTITNSSNTQDNGIAGYWTGNRVNTSSFQGVINGSNYSHNY